MLLLLELLHVLMVGVVGRKSHERDAGWVVEVAVPFAFPALAFGGFLALLPLAVSFILAGALAGRACWGAVHTSIHTAISVTATVGAPGRQPWFWCDPSVTCAAAAGVPVTGSSRTVTGGGGSLCHKHEQLPQKPSLAWEHLLTCFLLALLLANRCTESIIGTSRWPRRCLLCGVFHLSENTGRCSFRTPLPNSQIAELQYHRQTRQHRTSQNLLHSFLL